MKLNGKDTFLLFLKGKSFEHKGDFDATAIYQNTNQIIDCVLYNGTSYYCKKTTTAGILPTNTEYWGVMASSNTISKAEKDASNLSEEDKKQWFLLTHPIKSYYITEETENPIDKYGGGWLRIQGKFLLGADGSIYKVGDADGGETTHTLTIDEMPRHQHGIKGYNGNAWTTALPKLTDATGGSNTIYTDMQGNSQAHNNMPPYHIVNIWKRIS